MYQVFCLSRRGRGTIMMCMIKTLIVSEGSLADQQETIND